MCPTKEQKGEGQREREGESERREREREHGGEGGRAQVVRSQQRGTARERRGRVSSKYSCMGSGKV